MPPTMYVMIPNISMHLIRCYEMLLLDVLVRHDWQLETLRLIVQPGSSKDLFFVTVENDPPCRISSAS